MKNIIMKVWMWFQVELKSTHWEVGGKTMYSVWFGKICYLTFA